MRLGPQVILSSALSTVLLSALRIEVGRGLPNIHLLAPSSGSPLSYRRHALTDRGYLRIGDLPETLAAQTSGALKALLKDHGQKTTGRKADLVNRALESVTSPALEAAFPHSWYVVTEAGQKVLDDSPHIPYVHKNTLLDSVDIYSLDRLVQAEPDTPWREVVWRHLDEQVALHARQSDWGLLRNTRHLMAEFLAEQGRWTEAIEILAEVIYYDLAIPGNSFGVDVVPLLASRISGSAGLSPIERVR